MKRIYFDIETSPLPETDIAHLAPKFEAPANYKDPDKIAANLAEQKAAWLLRGALSPLTGTVVAIGVIQSGQIFPMLASDEGQNESILIARFWELYRAERERSLFIGFNIKRFDLPFLIKRSWKIGLPLPLGIWAHRYFSDDFLDLLEVWQLSNREERISLDSLCKYLGVGAKSGSGADFYKLPVEQQREYLTSDLKLTELCANKLLAA